MSHHSCNEALRQQLTWVGIQEDEGYRGCGEGRFGPSGVTLGVRTERCDGGWNGINTAVLMGGRNECCTMDSVTNGGQAKGRGGGDGRSWWASVPGEQLWEEAVSVIVWIFPLWQS